MRCVTPTRASAPRQSCARMRRAIDVEVDDPGVLHDIDEPADYARVFNQRD